MRKKIVAGNWKMNCTKQEAEQLANQLSALNIEKKNIKVFVSSIHLSQINSLIDEKIIVGAQNMYYKNEGAYTGEISPKQIKSYDIDWVLLGHSERRNIFKETDDLLKEKVDAALENDLHVMFCIGEKLIEREAGKAESVVKAQLEKSLFHLSKSQWAKIVIAYEPVWAIGTGVAATPQEAQEMHAYIRSLIVERYDQQTAEHTSILYGGSVKPANAEEIFAQQDIDGGLIGGASLQAESFNSIIQAI